MELMHDRDCHSHRDYVTKWDNNLKQKKNPLVAVNWHANVGIMIGKGNTAIWIRVSPILKLVDHYCDNCKLTTDQQCQAEVMV